MLANTTWFCLNQDEMKTDNNWYQINPIFPIDIMRIDRSPATLHDDPTKAALTVPKQRNVNWWRTSVIQTEFLFFLCVIQPCQGFVETLLAWPAIRQLNSIDEYKNKCKIRFSYADFNWETNYDKNTNKKLIRTGKILIGRDMSESNCLPLKIYKS